MEDRNKKQSGHPKMSALFCMRVCTRNPYLPCSAEHAEGSLSAPCAILLCDELFAAAQENAQWRYKSYLRMLGTAW